MPIPASPPTTTMRASPDAASARAARSSADSDARPIIGGELATRMPPSCHSLPTSAGPGRGGGDAGLSVRPTAWRRGAAGGRTPTAGARRGVGCRVGGALVGEADALGREGELRLGDGRACEEVGADVHVPRVRSEVGRPDREMSLFPCGLPQIGRGATSRRGSAGGGRCRRRRARSRRPGRGTGVTPPIWNGQPAPRIRQRSMSSAAATTSSSSIRWISSARPSSMRVRSCSAVSGFASAGLVLRDDRERLRVVALDLALARPSRSMWPYSASSCERGALEEPVGERVVVRVEHVRADRAGRRARAARTGPSADRTGAPPRRRRRTACPARPRASPRRAAWPGCG